MQKRGLGKGLQALLPEAEAESGREEGVREIEVALVKPNPFQPRKAFDGEKLEELAESIREHGVVQPIVVRVKGEGYEIVAGERRWRASRLAGLKAIPAVIREFSETEVMEIALIENLQREDLNPLEEAEAYDRLIREFGMTQEDLARRLSKSRPQISNTLRLLQLGDGLRQRVATGAISVGHAKVLLSVTDARERDKLGAAIAERGLSVREAEALLRKEAKSGNKPSARGGRKPGRDPGLVSVEEQLGERFGTIVRVVGGEGKGRIELSYYGNEDLQRLVDELLA
ncbi:MAG: ParB/RepB/Spo0J family partition protein [Symbiobacteriia bacterium]